MVHSSEEKALKDFLKAVYKDILEKNTDEFNCDYLYTTLKVVNSRIKALLYNKTDSFNFKVIRCLHSGSSISNKVKSAGILSDTHRIAHTAG